MISYPDDGPVIDVPDMGAVPWKEYFDRAVACGDLYGCGARDWRVEPTFWYPRPGRQFEVTCNRCGNLHGVEVRK